MALSGSGSMHGDAPPLDNEVDIIHTMQERDAYKQETEKLRRIIDRQRFIIKSLQDQIARKQSITAADAPQSDSAEMATGSSALRSSTTHEQQQQQQQQSLAENCPSHSTDAASHALGILSLDARPLSSATTREAVAPQAPAALSESEQATDGFPAQNNGRPWAKSTRLSEIYADYSARHNSVAPMFKASFAAWDVNSETLTQQPASSTAGGSFVENLKASTQRAELGAGDENEDEALSGVSDLSSEGQISSLAMESSREQSVSIDVGDREGLLSNVLRVKEPIPASAEYLHSSSAAATRAIAPTLPRTGVSVKTAVSSAGAINTMSTENNAVAASPEAKLTSPASHSASDHLVLRPISIVTAHDGPDPSEDEDEDEAISAQTTNEDNQWRASRIANYEYGAPEGGVQENSGSTLVVPKQQQQSQNRSDSSPSLGQSVGVRWAVDATEPARSDTSNNPFEQRISRARAGSSNPSESDSVSYTPRSAPSMRSKSDVQSEHGESSRLEDAGNAHHNANTSPMPYGTTSLYSAASSAKNMPTGPPLTSLQNIDIQIKDSRLKIDERGKEVNVYMIDVVWRKEISGLSLQEILIDSQQAEMVLWTVEKRYSDFLNLNGQLRHVIHREKLLDKLERLPDRDIFRPNAPTKSDKRKLWFERYLKKALSLSVADKRPLLEFLSSNQATEPEKQMPILLGHKEGFLVKKGKNFGGWKRRYYVCKSNKPVLEYSELPGGNIIGTINLSGAVVKTGKSRPEESPSTRARSGSRETEMFRHAFLIEERPKREGKDPIAHPLWADSDRERDEWVMALRYVIVRDSDGPERAMREVTKLVKHAKSKESKPLMIHQIQTSISHEQGARKSLEQSRRKEEQRAGNGSARHPNDPQAQPQVAGKFGSPLSKQMWPATGSLDNVGVLSSGGSDVGVNATDSEPKSDAAMDQQYSLSHDSGRPRSLSLPPAQDGDQKSSVHKQARSDAAAVSARPSPAAIATTLSTSFTGYNESLSDQTEDISIHYMPSDISTIESSIYSSYNGNSSGSRHNDISSRSIGDRNSYASMPESPVSPTRQMGPAARAANSDLVATDSSLTAAYSGAHMPNTDFSGIGRVAGTSHGHRLIGDPSKQIRQPAIVMAKSQFTKNAVGRIVHEEERAPDLPAVTPHVTDDILGVGRQEPGRDGGRAANADAPARTREDKKRGRITFMWGKRKPTEAEPPVPDFDLSGGGSSGFEQPASTPPPAAITAPRRLRRGSVSGEHRHGSSKNAAFKGPVFGQSLERTVESTRIREHYQLPSIVYRCIEYLDAKKAWLEEGIYRQSGSSLALTQLRKEFNTNRDYNLLKLSKLPDIHAVASLLKAYLRELPENVLTARLYQEFVRVVDLAERHDRVHELGRLVSELPLANYTLLRALTAHLIRIVQKASTNKMTLRNIGIVFSPSLGIPVGVFSLLMVEFEYIFWVNDSGAPEPRLLASASADVPPVDASLSASVPAGMNKIPNVTLHSAGSSSRIETVSRIAGTTVSVSRELAGQDSAFPYHHPDVSDGGGGGHRAQSNTLSMAAVTPAPWYSQVNEVDGGAALSQDLSRYPGMSVSSTPQHTRAQVQAVGSSSGRSNRNSIQYNVGAPRELISQEAGISVPETISESDFDDDSDGRISTNGDPMMRLNRYDSSSMLQSNSALSRS